MGHLGNWQIQEEQSKADVDLKKLKNGGTDDPLRGLNATFGQEANSLVPVDQQGQELWKKMGCLGTRSTGPTAVHGGSPSAPPWDASLQAEADFQRNHQHGLRMLPSPPQDQINKPLVPHCLDTMIPKSNKSKKKDIEHRFQGKPSAYLLFCQKSWLQSSFPDKGCWHRQAEG